jgi:HSP20 family protein
MTTGKWGPFGSMGPLQDGINRLFDEAFPHPKTGGASDERWVPAVDIYDAGNRLILQVDLPGVERDAIALEVKNEVLMIAGERPAETGKAEHNYHRRERGVGKFRRAFSLSGLVDPETVSASFKRGVLEVIVPRPRPDKPRRVDLG